MKKLLTITMVVILVLSMVSCSGNDISLVETDLDKPITFKWVMPGPGSQTDSQMVWTKFNEELHKIEGFENVTVEIEVIPNADYSQKMMLMQTSGENMDLVQTFGLDYAKNFREGAFLDMAPYLEKYAKQALKELPEWVVNMGKIEGAQAILPNYQKMTAAPWAITMPKELIDKYEIDIESMREAIQSEKTWGDKSRESLEGYLKKIYEGGDIWKGYAGVNLKGYDNIVGSFGYNYYNKDVKVESYHFNDWSEDNFRWFKKLYNNGYVRKDVLSAKASDFSGIQGGNVLYGSQVWSGTQDIYIDTTSEDIDLVKVPIESKFFIPYKPSAGGFAIPVNSRYPDVAAKLINLMCASEGKELYNLLVYGIEGVHYEVVKEIEGDKVIKPFDYVEEGNSSARYGLNKWIVGNAKNAYLTTNVPENFKEIIYVQMNEGENTLLSPLMGFALVSDTIDTKLSQYGAVTSEYASVLNSGAVDTEKLIAEFTAKAEAAGRDEIIAEIQKQVDEFLEKNK